MAEEKKVKKTRSMDEEERNYRIIRNTIGQFFRLVYPARKLHMERIPEGACILCPNHSSWVDPPVVCVNIPQHHAFHIMAKKQLIETPVVGPVISTAGVFGVDRGGNDIVAIKRALKVLKDGRKLLIFPEGTRVAEEGSGEAKTGAIMLAMKTGAPLVPVYMDHDKKPFRRLNVVIGEPYTVKPAGKRATQAEYHEAADELLRRIYALEEEIR